MSSKTYTEDDIERLGEVMAERIISKMQPALEALDEIREQVSNIPNLTQSNAGLTSDMQTVKFAIKETNKELRQLDKAVGNVEHRVDNLNTLVLSHYAADRTLEKRVAQLEAAA